MQKTWETIRQEVIHLGFEKGNVYEKNKSAFIHAFNWAQNFIASSVCPIEKNAVVQINQSPFDLKQLEGFLRLSAEKPVTVKDEKPISYTLKANRFLSLPLNTEVQIFYHSYPKQINVNTPEDFVSDIEGVYLNLMPYLMAHRLWLDDDMAKSVHYWNLYDDMKNQIESQKFNDFSCQVHEGWGV